MLPPSTSLPGLFPPGRDPAPSARSRNALGTWAPIAFAVMFTVAVRAAVALSRADEVEFELESGSLAWALLGGMPLDTARLPVIDHQRGSVVTVGITALWMACLGLTFFALKAAALTWSAATAALVSAAAGRAAGPAAAWTAGLLVALLPPAFQIVDVMALGSHAELVPFLFAAVCLAQSFERERPTRARLFWFGAALGAGLLMGTQFLIAAPLLVLWVWRQPWRDESAWPAAITAAAIAVGSAPWWLPSLALVLPPWTGPLALAAAAAALMRPFPAFAACAGFFLAVSPIPFLSRQLGVFGRDLSGHLGAGEEGVRAALGSAADKLAGFWGGDLKRAWLFHDFGGSAAAWLYATSLLIALVLLFGRLRRREGFAWFLVLYPLAWSLAYAFAAFEFDTGTAQKGLGSRYLLPVLPCFAVALALGVGNDLGPWAKRAGRLAAALALVAGGLGIHALWSPQQALAQPPRLGVAMGLMRGHMHDAGGGDPAAIWEWSERLDPDWRDGVPWRYGEFADPTFASEGRPGLRGALVRLDAVEHPEARAARALALGVEAASQGHLLPRLPAALAQLDPEDRRWFLRGVGRGWISPSMYGRLAAERSERARLRGEGLGGRALAAALDEWRSGAPARVYDNLIALPPDFGELAAQGAGFWLGYRVSPHQRRLLDLFLAAERLPEPLQSAFFHAAGQGLRCHFIEATWFVPEPGVLAVEAELAPRPLAAFRAGLADPLEVLPGRCAEARARR